MAYEKTEWKNGDTITAEKLNHMEDGIENNANGVFIVRKVKSTGEEPGDYHLNKTFGEIRSAFESGKIIVEYNYDFEEEQNQIGVSYKILEFDYNAYFYSSDDDGYGYSGYVGGYSIDSYFEEPPTSLEEVLIRLDASYPYVTD